MSMIHRPLSGDPVDHGAVVAWLSGGGATEVSSVGAKAANLALAGRVGLPVVDGFAIPVAVVRQIEGAWDQIRPAWDVLSQGGTRAVVVRSSSPHEDSARSSMAGVFHSVVDVRDWDGFMAACRTVVASAAGADIAVLVQQHVDPQLGGVLFGLDPVSGRTDRRVVAAVAGGPWQLVGGEVAGRRFILDPRGRLLTADGDARPDIGRKRLRSLVRLEHRAAGLFGGPQDVEWAVSDGELLLLQSRPVTAAGTAGSGPLLGAGPVAETFPNPLSPLEQDLWVPPLRDATVEALALTGSVGRRRLERGEVVRVVADQVVADLEVTGVAAPTSSRLMRMVDPRPGVRRLRAAWRVGRLRGAIAAISTDLVDHVDAELRSVPDLQTLDDTRLLDLLENCRSYLRALHGHEILVGALTEPTGASAASVALRAIGDGRRRGWSDEDIIARAPVVLAVVPPSIGPRRPLPPVLEPPGATADTDRLSVREDLRLRVRWVHELCRAVTLELGHRLTLREVIPTAVDVRRLGLDDLRRVLHGEPVALSDDVTASVAPLPAVFRLADDGSVVAEPTPGGLTGVGAGGGRASGTVAHTDPAPGAVLVVTHLAPDLAPLLPGLAAIVSETGSPLSHLAILAREHGVPVVVGYGDARRLLRPGAQVLVDGNVGTVDVVAASSAVGS